VGSNVFSWACRLIDKTRSPKARTFMRVNFLSDGFPTTKVLLLE
jgi:hypothetical protein